MSESGEFIRPPSGWSVTVEPRMESATFRVVDDEDKTFLLRVAVLGAVIDAAGEDDADILRVPGRHINPKIVGRIIYSKPDSIIPFLTPEVFPGPEIV